MKCVKLKENYDKKQKSLLCINLSFSQKVMDLLTHTPRNNRFGNFEIST